MRLSFKAAIRCWILLFTLVVVAFGIDTRAADTNPLQVSAGNTNQVKVVAEVKSVSLTTNATVLTFGLNRIELLQYEAPKGFPLWQYLASLIYIILAFVISKFVDQITRVYLKQWAAKTKTKLDDLLLLLIDGPIKIVSFVILLHLGLRMFQWPAVVEDYLDKGMIIVVAWSLTYMGVKFVDLLMAYWKQKVVADADRVFDEQLIPVVRRSLQVFIVVVAVLLTSDHLGLKINSVLASLSVGGLALGLAAQDTLANLFGALSVFVDKPFRIGDRILLDGVDGTVETIGLRSTRVRNLEGYLVTIPNKTMGNAVITNVTRRPTIKTVMNFGLTYDTSDAKLKRAIQILEEVYKSHAMTADLSVSFNKFGDSALNIQVVHMWKSTDAKAQLAGMQDLNIEIKRRFDQEGINFAFPTQTLYVKQDSDWKMNSAGQEPNRLT